jgi:DNA polymerase
VTRVGTRSCIAVLWRVVNGHRRLLEDAADDDVIVVTRMAKAVDRASHKMKAFVRFREVHTADGARYIAWFEPEHDVLSRTAPFFASRFGTMLWTIVTPDGGARWDRKSLCFFDADPACSLPSEDGAESLWLTYYESIFNPARLNVPMMRKEMPAMYWKNLPEAARIPGLVANAMPRAGQMVETAVTRERPAYRGAGPKLVANARSDGMPDQPGLDACRRCALGLRATQGVAGKGPANARLMLVGEQPGDEEDLAGKPFVGPAGKVLRRALEDAGIDIGATYVTNAVKHFSFEPRGKRRIHKTPAQREIDACRTWLDAEIAHVRPAVIVALGASALYGVLRRRVAVGVSRDEVFAHASGARVVATYHPSSVLREKEEAGKAARYAALVSDLRAAVVAAREHTSATG